jgi:predicted transcriptional regulator of viral defense system
MTRDPTEADELVKLTEELGAFRLHDARARGIHPEVVYRSLRAGKLERVGRGLYRAPDGMFTENHGLVLAAKTAPGGIVCLLSALQFHELTTQLPSQVWVAIDRRAARPRVHGLPLRIVRFSGPALSLGVEEHVIEGVTVRVYSAPKTVVDCFRYRNTVGLDVAMEALRDCRRQNKCTPAELWDIARATRIGSVIRPYIEAVG